MGDTNRASSTVEAVIFGFVSDDAPLPARVTLPSDLAGSLKYLEDAQLQRLIEAVAIEMDRRRQGTSGKKAAAAEATRTSSEGQASDRKIREINEIPEGRANLIRASFRAGIKPATIARTFRLSRSLVNRVLSSTEKPKRG
jgi:DNA invertase Pin-like site-specific DNA recombinase